MTSPSLRPVDGCGPYRMMNGHLCVQVEQLSVECANKFGFTAQKLRWVSLTVCSLVLRPGTYGAWNSSFLIWRVMREDIILLKDYGIPKGPRFAKHNLSVEHRQLRIMTIYRG